MRSVRLRATSYASPSASPSASTPVSDARGRKHAPHVEQVRDRGLRRTPAARRRSPGSVWPSPSATNRRTCSATASMRSCDSPASCGERGPGRDDARERGDGERHDRRAQQEDREGKADQPRRDAAHVSRPASAGPPTSSRRPRRSSSSQRAATDDERRGERRRGRRPPRPRATSAASAASSSSSALVPSPGSEATPIDTVTPAPSTVVAPMAAAQLLGEAARVGGLRRTVDRCRPRRA